MAHITNKLRGLVAAFVAVFAALALVPGTAFAAYQTQTGDIEVSGVHGGDTVTIYRVVEYKYDDGANTVSWDFASTIADLGIDKGDYRETTDGTDPNAIEQIDRYAAQMAKEILDPESGFKGFSASKDVPADGTSVTFDDMEDGEYLIVVTPGEGTARVYQYAIAKLEPVQTGSDWAINGGDGMVNMELKSADEPPVEKTANGDSGHTSSTPVGEDADFTVTTTVPLYPENATNEIFRVRDAMSDGLTFNDDVVVKVANPDGDPITLSEGADYKVLTGGEITGTYDPAPDFVIEFVYDSLRQYAGRELTVTYTAEIGEGAAHVENNQVTVDFTNNPFTEGDYDHNDDDVDLYTYDLTITKKDVDTDEPLSGATFELYFVEDGQEGATTGGVKVGTLTTVSGTATATGLAAGHYYLVETAAPTGYQLDATPIPFEVVAATTDGLTPDNEIFVQAVPVITNQKQDIDLPTTGGAGTVALTAAGVVLIAGAAAFIVRSRKQN